MNSIKRLINCVLILGIKNGYSYWKFQNHSIKNPKFALHWANNCEQEAEEEADKLKKEILRDWAKKLRENYYSYQSSLDKFS